MNEVDEIKLQIIEPTNEQNRILYELLKSREFSISHTNLPEYIEHEYFVKNNPYRVWMLVYQRKIPIGTVYILEDNNIGISLKNYSESLIKNLINSISKSYKPLPPIKSVRGKYFHINVNPSNQELITTLKKNGLTHIQNTYAII